MWINPTEILLAGAIWSSERSNSFFVLQKRVGHGHSGGIMGKLVGTVDHIVDSNAPPYRILHQTCNSEVYYVIAEANNQKSILRDWDFIETNIMPVLGDFDRESDIMAFVKCKIESLVAIMDSRGIKDEDTEKFKLRSAKYYKMFSMNDNEKLVNYYSCSHFKGKLPRQGWMYLSVNHLCFYSLILGKEDKLILRWTDIIKLERSYTLLGNNIIVETREEKYYFYLFRHIADTFKLMQQLANIAVRQLMAEDGYSQDIDLPPRVKKRVPKKVE